jgi:uncharacterized protein YndB with AHSA1/START domain
MTNTPAANKAVTVKRTFSRETTISIDIQADKATIWALLTNADDYPRWNSTVVSMVGTITEGARIQLKSTLDPKRVFKLSVKEFVANSRMVWYGSMGKRVLELKTLGNGLTNFTMAEKIGGPIFPLFAKMIPPFDGSFEQFARDLKKQAEKISNNQ